MGMGDKKIPYVPTYGSEIDNVLGKPFAVCTTRKCPHPKIIERFGIGGTATVSIYTCKRCHWHKEYPYHGGISCEYGMGKLVPPGEEVRMGRHSTDNS